MNSEITDRILSSFFSDETELYRIPAEPEPGETVRIRLRTAKYSVSRALFHIYGQDMGIIMRKVMTDEGFDYFETEIACGKEEIGYCFAAECGGERILYDKLGARFVDCSERPDRAFAFRFTPGFHVPEWSKGAVQYQIFTDRFRNGNKNNDVQNNEYYYAVGHSRQAASWDAPPDDTDIRTFYGGDLQGVMEKLDYLQELGVEVIYFNPVFISPSSHKYDIQDYEHIDPHFGIITDDVEHGMQPWEKHNGYAPRYIKRTTSAKNLEASDAFFASFCGELHRRGMRIILDGVFNHCGSFNKWMDREGIYLGIPDFEKGAYQDVESPYRSYFRFSSRGGGSRYGDYEGWWGHETLPKLNYEGSPELKEEIMRIAEKWALPPYSIDGWRLDVAADLGHSSEYNHEFWKEFRKRLKKINPDLLIIAEHYGSAAPWLNGYEWDTVMNYDAFMDPLSYFLTGMEKHSDGKRDDLYLDGYKFFESMLRNMAQFEKPSLDCAMNELSNHDHSRFLTRTNRRVGRTAGVGADAAGVGIRKGVFRQAVTVQMTWPGAPTVYYADEAGQVGWTDPDNRRTYPWGREDKALIDFHKALTSLRKEHPVLKKGSFKPLLAQYGLIAYSRFDDSDAVITVINCSPESRTVALRVIDGGVYDGEMLVRSIFSDENGFNTAPCALMAYAGEVSFEMPAGSAAIFCKGD